MEEPNFVLRISSKKKGSKVAQVVFFKKVGTF